MKKTDTTDSRKLWLGLAALLASLAVLFFLAADLIGLGPNLGLPFGYYGRYNRILALIEASPDVEVVRTTLHRDSELEDFYITVRTLDEAEVRLSFQEAHTRPYSQLVKELSKVGL